MVRFGKTLACCAWIAKHVPKQRYVTTRIVKQNHKVVIGMSGGIDSTIAAYLLKQQGFQVQGVYMKNWDPLDEDSKNCNQDKDYEDVKYACGVIDIPCRQINFVKTYWNEVFSKTIKLYESGITPNPDVLCNREIKFKAFLHFALTELKADAIATGHYARVRNSEKGYQLLRGIDIIKDQSYFLSQVSSEALRHCIFPVGNMEKNQVKQLGSELGLHRILNRPESMGICFVGKRKFSDFLHEYITPKKGSLVCVETGKILGVHNGLVSLTIGQKALIGGQAHKYYVVGKSMEKNEVYVAASSEHSSFYTTAFVVSDAYFREKPEGEFICHVQTRYRQSAERATVYPFLCSGRLLHRVVLDQPMKSIAPGQISAFYDNEICIGAGTIGELER